MEVKRKRETFFYEWHDAGDDLRLAGTIPPSRFPTSIYYAFKQSERKGDTGITSTGWETFLDAAIIYAGFS